MSLSVGIIIPNMGKIKFHGSQPPTSIPWAMGIPSFHCSSHQLLHGLLDGHFGIMDVGLVVKDKILMIDLGT
jgi:hypothetical protein